MTDLTSIIRTSGWCQKDSYPVHIRTEKDAYTLISSPHKVRELLVSMIAQKLSMKIIGPDCKEVYVIPCGAKFEESPSSAKAPSLSEEEEKMIEIQLLGEALIRIFRDIRSDAKLIASMIEEMTKEIKGKKHDG